VKTKVKKTKTYKGVVKRKKEVKIKKNRKEKKKLKKTKMSDEKQSKTVYGGSTAALEGFEALVKSSSGQAVVMVIQQVLKHPQIFVFGELLEATSVKELANSQHKLWYDLLRLFASGTYQDYKARSELPKLSAPQLTKLKQLSVVEYAAKNKALSYEKLLADLDLSNVRELEDIIIDCVYLGLIQGKLDQRKRCFEVQSVIGRDLGPGEVEDMIGQLNTWLTSSDSVLKTLEKKIEQENTQYEKKNTAQSDIEKQKKDIVETIKSELQNGNQEALALVYGDRGGGGGGPRGQMDDARRGGGRRKGSGGGMRKMFGGGGRKG
jgi:COP9 signalosome complex subunit 7